MFSEKRSDLRTMPLFRAGKVSLFAIVIMASLLSAVSAGAEDNEKPDHWELMRFFVGKWTGTGEGKSGISNVEREYRFILGDNYIRVYNRSVFEVQEMNPKGEVHENLDFISYDGMREKFVLRQFHIEGFINKYILTEVSEDGKTLVFETEDMENAPPGWTARVTLTIEGEESFRETFDLSPGGSDYGCWNRNVFYRVKDSQE